MSENNDVKMLQVQLLGWKKQEEDHKTVKPPTVTFALQSDEDIAFFQNYTVKKGKVAGQLFAMGIRISPDDAQSEDVKPVQKERKLSQEAYLLCREPKFWEWMKVSSSKDADIAMKKTLCICSKVELDDYSNKAENFILFRDRFRQWVNK